MRALLRAAHRWVSGGTAPPPSSHPTLRDGSLTSLNNLRFPALPGVTDPRLVEGPLPTLPFLVPQVDADGNDVGGIRVPEVAVPLATTTGWNFRAARLGNPTTIVALLGSYLPFARTHAEREANKDPRPSIEERYKSKDDYLTRIRAAALAQVKSRFMLEEDLDYTLQRAARHWDWAMTR
jgi:alpha/beta hydrolase family protein